ncbi:MAG: hypothetical protein AAGC93_25095 [Cyanobacteria bacterium P01_F01_bin.53]
MKQSSGYILVIGQPLRHLPKSPSTENLYTPVVTATSPEQAIAKAQAEHPHLVIISGDPHQDWSPQVARQIRQSVQPEGVVIVALTESSDLSWSNTTESSEIDGVFVKPLSADVLSSLNESAIAKKRCLNYTHSIG